MMWLEVSKSSLVIVLALVTAAACVGCATRKPAQDAGADAVEQPVEMKPEPATTSKFEREFEATRFHRGNTHTHSVPGSFDADTPSHKVLAWYRDHGYQFVALTEHFTSGTVGEHPREQRPDEFRTLPAEEVTFSVGRHPRIAVHFGALCSEKSAGQKTLRTTLEALSVGLRHIREQQGAVAQINHPNYTNALSAETIVAGLDAEWSGRPVLLEIANQHPSVNNDGTTILPSTEILWNTLLSKNYRVYGVASDDMHHLTKNRKELGGKFDPLVPGLGWVQVEAEGVKVEPRALCGALAEGHFYSSTGVAYDSIRVTATTFELQIAARAGVEDDQWTTRFYVSDGRELESVRGRRANYVLTGGERWVRAKTCGPGETRHYSNGVVTLRETCAWTQPQWVRSPSP